MDRGLRSCPSSASVRMRAENTAFAVEDRSTMLIIGWSAGFAVTIPEFSRSNFFTMRELRMKVTGRETVTVPAGAFDCCKVMTEIKNEGILVDTRETWISVKKNIRIKMNFLNKNSVELVETTIEPKSISNFQESALESRYNQNFHRGYQDDK